VSIRDLSLTITVFLIDSVDLTVPSAAVAFAIQNRCLCKFSNLLTKLTLMTSATTVAASTMATTL